MSIRVLLADDHKIVRDGLHALLDKDAEVNVVGMASNGQIAWEKSKELCPDVVVIDIGMPIMNGLEATERIIEDQPEMKVIALSMHSDRGFVQSMFDVGACGYLLKDCAFDELQHAIRIVLSGKKYISPSLVSTLGSHCFDESGISKV